MRTSSSGEEPASDDPSTPREPSGAAFNRLAPVLSMLARASQLPLKDLSSRTRCSASYLSRVLSGERTPTWTLTERFARACGADSSVLRTVWESERLREKEPVSLPEDASLPAGARLLNALNTLHVRAGRPTPYDISVASRWRLAVEEVAPVLEGAQIPSWPFSPASCTFWAATSTTSPRCGKRPPPNTDTSPDTCTPARRQRHRKQQPNSTVY
ncbi:helix-turn-helix domain-containing protein [Streptomyces sp. NPDC057543]|uniref:helix-turn-helix domain-containing protein n=1 Tax=Streptomyces sp. NPDC057543 TaxID=3346163 RepID=UPI0036791344